jgi:hypothetical protein
MHYFLAAVCFFGLVAPAADASDLTIRLTGKWLKMFQEFEAKSSAPGEFSEVKRDSRIRYELRAEGFLAPFNQDKEFSDNKVLGVDAAGSSDGFLVEEKGKYFWRLVREWKDKAGKHQTLDQKWEVVFASGDWKGFVDGDDVELVLTQAAQEEWNKFVTGLVISFAEDLRTSYSKQFPKVTVQPVVTEVPGNKKTVRILGNSEKMVVEGSDSFLVAKVLVTL